MNDLLWSLFSKGKQQQEEGGDEEHAMEIITEGGVELEKFFQEVESVKEEVKELERLNLSLRATNQHSKGLHSPKGVRDVRSRMDLDVALSLAKANQVKTRLEALHRANQATLSLPGCGPGSYSHRTRTALLQALTNNLKHSMDSFSTLREQISNDYIQTLQRRYYALTGHNPDQQTIDLLISTGESETFLQKAIQQQGRATIMDTIQEIQERHGSVKEIERNLQELNQVFLDMALLIQPQGEHLDDIESHVALANSFVNKGVQHLQVVKNHQKNTRNWTCFAILLFIIMLVIVLPIVFRN